jgi:cell division protease FtsH
MDVKGRLKTLLIWAGLVAVFLALFSLSSENEPSLRVGFDTFRRSAAVGGVDEVWVDNNEITFRLIGTDRRYATLGVVDAELEQTLSDHGVVVHRGKPSNLLRTVLIWSVAVAVVLFLFFRLLRRSQGGMGNILSLRKSRARLIPESSAVTFNDVGGCVEAKELLGDLIDFLKDPERWIAAGARLPRGVLLEGPPGCGKTLLARAVAGETNARFYLVSASEFVEMFVGVGAARVRDMFETAVKNAPAVIFIDELDSVGRRRGSGIGSGHDEREQTLNQLLTCLDGFEDNDRVVVVAATNRPDILDQALLRPGRFDRRIRIPALSSETRLEVLQIHTRNKNLAPDVSLQEWVDRTDGFNGAQLESLANEAALLAVRRSRNSDGQPAVVGREDCERALQPSGAASRLFDRLDAVLIESATQLAEPTGKAVVRLTLSDDTVIQGEVVWVDATFVKVRNTANGEEVILSKRQVHKLEALEGTQTADPRDVATDAWAAKPRGTA